jgi:hypothetical protein
MVRDSDFLTVATVSHIPPALVTLNSARRYAPNAGSYLFALDATADTIEKLPDILGEAASGIHFFGPHNLGSERNAFLNAFKYYNPVEMSCLAKYVGLSHVLKTSSADSFVYADADILFLKDIGEAVCEIGDGVVLATLHQLGITSDDTEHEYLLYGWLNAGFFCIRRDPQIQQVLNWLIHRVSRRGFYAPHYGMSADQTWFSSLPFVFQNQTRISRHPGLNVGYWNIRQRQLTRDRGEFRINGKPLLVFHFSGFNPAEPSMLSKYFDIEVTPGSLMDELCKAYSHELDAVAPLKAKVADLTKIMCSQDKLDDRMLKGSIDNKLSLVMPSIKTGLYSRIGRRVDFELSRIAAKLNSLTSQRWRGVSQLFSPNAETKSGRNDHGG